MRDQKAVMNAKENDQLREKAFIRHVEVTAIHEAGHLVVAHHFGHIAEFRVWLPENEPPLDWMEFRQTRGRCSRQWHPTARHSPFTEACVCWAGIIAERIADHDFKIDLTEFRWEWEDFKEQLDAEDEVLSQTDRVGILGHHQRWRAAKKALEIIMAHRQALELAVQKVRHDLVDLRKCVTWVHPEDIGLTPHIIRFTDFTEEVPEVAAA